MSFNPIFFSYFSVSLLSIVVMIYLVIGKNYKFVRNPVLLFLVINILWSLGHTYNTLIPSINLLFILEGLRYATWWLLFFLLLPKINRKPSTTLLLASVITLLLIILIYPNGSTEHDQGNITPTFQGNLKLYSIILTNIIALAAIEQIIRHAGEQDRWRLKYLLLSSGSLLIFDFFVFSDALLFDNINEEFWLARGYINAIIVPLIGFGIVRIGSSSFQIKISRNILFHSASIIAMSSYLILMAIAGYYVRYIDESLGGFYLLIFLFSSIVFLASLLLSDKLRQSIRVMVNKHFYGLKHDYRKQWALFTNNLASNQGEVPICVCQSLAQLIGSSGALLWSRERNNSYQLAANWHIPRPSNESFEDLTPLINFLSETQWVIDIEEYKEDPDFYENLKLPRWMSEMNRAWLIVPLFFQEEVLGLVLLKRSDMSMEINWEDRDLLKLAGKQAAIHLSQFHSEKALIEARQFEAYHRLSTYVMHDLKNILAQQSLIVSNAQKHKDNPKFIDDVITTIENSVDRMQRLLKQMKSGDRVNCVQPISIKKSLQHSLKSRNELLPIPELEICDQDPLVNADGHQLTTIFEHLIQNAQEATDVNGTIKVSLHCDESESVINISDTGSGMSDSFIRDRLFKPFDTTKGLAGMGIGVFESRQYLTSINGTLHAYSKEGYGSTFTITLPSYLKNDVNSTDNNNVQPTYHEIIKEA